MFGTDKATVSEVTLTKIRFGIQDMVSGSFLRDMEYSEQWDLSNDALIRRLRFYLLGNETHEERYNEDVRTYPVNPDITPCLITIWDKVIVVDYGIADFFQSDFLHFIAYHFICQ